MDEPSTLPRTVGSRDSPDEHDNILPSPEPPTTRPNPFDDCDLSARKRRRTSGSMSPPLSPDNKPSPTHIVANITTSPTNLHRREQHAPALGAIEGSDIICTPQTPASGSRAKSSSTPASSSRVTLNLKKTNSLPLVVQDLASPASMHGSINTDLLAEETTLVEEPHLEKTGSNTPQLSDSTSPSVEAVALSGNEAGESDDELTFQADKKITRVLGHRLPLVDPISQFPYSEPNEDPYAPLMRLIHYLSSHSPVDGKIIVQVQDWMEDYLNYVQEQDDAIVLDSREACRTFWLMFPEVIAQLSLRSLELFSSSVELRNDILGLCSTFTSLAAQMVALDSAALRKIQLHRDVDCHQCPEVYSSKYLESLHDILSLDAWLTAGKGSDSAAYGWHRNEVRSHLLATFQSHQGGSVAHLSHLISSLISLTPRFPKLIDSLAFVAQILADCLQRAVYVLDNDSDSGCVAQVKNFLEMSTTAWNRIFACLGMMIEKNVTQLSVETAAILLQALTEILKLSLRGDHAEAVDTVRHHMRQYPNLSDDDVAESIAWQWRIDILDRLIRSSQMQLRVMAISKLCADLVTVWRNAMNDVDESHSFFLRTLGTYLLQTHLIDYIFGPNCHPEIIAESSNILGFLIVIGMYRQDHTNRLWQGLTLCQDPRIAEALARMVVNITNLFDYDGLLSWCQKFQTLPLEAFSPSMRTLWDHVMNGMISRCQSEQHVPSSDPYDLCLKLLKESSACTTGSQIADPELQRAAKQKLKDFLQLGPSPDGRKALYLSCINDIAAKSRTTLGSLWYLSIAIKGTMARDIPILTEQHDLAKLLVEELVQALHGGRGNGEFAVLSGDTNQPRRELLACIIQFQPTAIHDELGTTLLDILVGPKSPCAEDRKAGWSLITNVMRKSSLKNHFLQNCLSKYLPDLPASCFSDGMLEFVRERILYLAGDENNVALDDSQALFHSGIEQLWRIVLEADNTMLVSQAIATLAVDLYLESSAIKSYPFSRAKRIHNSLVGRCLDQMKQAASEILGPHDGLLSNGNENLIITAPETDVCKHKLIFKRSLQFLRFFVEKYQTHPQYGAPDLRPLMSTVPTHIKGKSAELKYQAFDDENGQSGIHNLQIGLQNTCAHLLGLIKTETGFENYRIYCRGQHFLPAEFQVSKTLHELQLHNNILLVKREEDISAMGARIKPGSSPLEIEILNHFQDLWDYLSMEDELAQEIYEFLVQLPANSDFTLNLESQVMTHEDIFLKGHAFKNLYAIHAIAEYVEVSRRSHSVTSLTPEADVDSTRSYHHALRKALRLVVHAVSDPETFGQVSPTLGLRIAGSLMQTFVKLVNDAKWAAPAFPLEDDVIPPATCLVDMLSKAGGIIDDAGFVLMESTCAAILSLGAVSPEFWSTATSNTSFLDDVINFVLKDPRKLVRRTVVSLIEDAMFPKDRLPSPENGECAVIAGSGIKPMVFSFCSAFIDALPASMSYACQSQEYFEALLYMVEQSCTRYPSSVRVESLAARSFELLLEHTSIERIDEPGVTDLIASGLSSVLHACIQIDETLVASIRIDESSVSQLFWRHLFPRKRRSDKDRVPRVVLNPDTRAKLCDIVFHFVRYNTDCLSQILETLTGLVPFYIEDPDDPYLYELPYQFDRTRAIRASCGYVGLRNLSNTCYLNSLFTQLFMNVRFRSFMLSIPIRDPEGSQQLLFFTQKLFAYMQESYQRFIDPISVVTSIKTYDDTLIDIHSQMDVDEFYNLLFDRWEGQLQDDAEKKLLRSFYGGQLVQQVKSKECQHISERLEPFSAIQCDIKGKSTLEESLEAYVHGEVMEGENKYKCSTCDRHVDAVKRACLKDVPDNLIFHLKRFDFNLRTMQRNKINDYFAFPQSLDVAPYTVEYLSSQSGARQSDLFELVGILVHSGTAESGHYYSYIRDPGHRSGWIEFNDDSVSPWDPVLMESSTFGGPDQQALHETNGMVYDRAYSAYMLFYQRASSQRPETMPEAASETTRPISVDIPQALKDHISDENKLFLRRHCLFDPNHTLFVQKCFSQAIFHLGESRLVESEPGRAGNDKHGVGDLGHGLQNLAMEVALAHFDQVVTRAKDLPFLSSFSSLLKTAVVKCCDCAYAFFSYFSRRHAVARALIQRNPETSVRDFASRTLILAVERIRSGLSRRYYNSSTTSTRMRQGEGGSEDDWEELESSPSVLQCTLDIFGHLWRYFHVHIRAWDEHFATMLAFARLGQLEVGHLLAEDYLLKLLRIISADAAADLPANYHRMVANLGRRFHSKPPSYAAILALIDHLLAQLEPCLGAEVIVDEAKDRRGARRPFLWTSGEVDAVHRHPGRQAASIFVEKLLDMDQVPEVTSSIIGRLVESGEELDMRVFNTLRRSIQGETSTQPMDSSIRAAGRYVESSESVDRAQSLIRHVCGQSRGFQHSEGSAFLNFFELVLQTRRPTESLARARRICAIQAIPTWAPYLLVYNDAQTRSNAERLIDHTLFNASSRDASEEEGGDAEQKRALMQSVIRQLGIQCLAYLREFHIKRRVQLERSSAGHISRVINKCAPYYDARDDADGYEDDGVAFTLIQGEIRSPLQRLLVDELDDDGSDWDGSCGSSELMNAGVGISIQSPNDGYD
ncbi:uncharacterized protein UV8b_06454 [Ustilaginoidea virens]|uniref:USP domain-containing protein n=1 Tax=Ustilaginoidea virens TaxID=1159556 RepID=A0A8E5HVA5_USTVR|nr:uncharacterized protein UV8b_06454 [Ustilaginoidea virens]QUC22213.1 hypothetical protein UV8b_06454 [Ustilaginoidea virens]